MDLHNVILEMERGVLVLTLISLDYSSMQSLSPGAMDLPYWSSREGLACGKKRRPVEEAKHF